MEETPRRKVLLAVDRSEFAEKAYSWYASQIKTDGDCLILCHCLEAVAMGMAKTGYTFSTGAWQQLYNEELQRVRILKHKYENKMKDDQICGKWVTINNGGHAGEAIIRVAGDEKPHLIIIGTRGLNTVRRTILGSVSDYVLHHAHCPVCVVRT